MQFINEDRQQIIPPQKMLFSKENHIDNIFIYSTINIKVLSHTILSVYREEEHIIDWSQFGSLDKVDFFKQANDMICAEVVKTTNTKIRLKESLNKVEDIRGNLRSKMGLIRKRANNKFCELEFKNQ